MDIQESKRNGSSWRPNQIGSKVGGKKQELSSYIYELSMMDKNGKIVVHFQVHGINRISIEVSRKNFESVTNLFRNIISDVIKGPTGEIDALIGFEYTGLHPV